MTYESSRGLKQIGCGLKQVFNFVQIAIHVDCEELERSWLPGEYVRASCRVFVEGTAEATIRANCPVVVTGRPLTIALATVRDLLSSPFS